MENILLRNNILCTIPGCNQHRKVTPCLSYRSCRLPVWSSKKSSEYQPFICGRPTMKRLDYCWFHEKFGDLKHDCDGE